jgi:hypothetical protein
MLSLLFLSVLVAVVNATPFGSPLNNPYACAPGVTYTLGMCRRLLTRWFDQGTTDGTNAVPGFCEQDVFNASPFLQSNYPGGCTKATLTTGAILGSSGTCRFYPPIVWIGGGGCVRDCAKKAMSMGKNPGRYCRSIGTTPTLNDGGCKVYFDCNISCKDTCSRHPYCEWQNGLCLSKKKLGGGVSTCTNNLPASGPC